MRKNYFAKLIRYMNNVYHIERGLKKLSDGRKNPTHDTENVVLIALLGFLLRVRSFNELNLMIKNNEFTKLFTQGKKLPQIDAIRDTLKVLDISGLKEINQHIIERTLMNKVLDNGTIDGYTVAAIDGTKFFGSNKKDCSKCLRITKSERVHYFHSGVVMATVGEGPRLVLDFEMYQPGIDSASKDEGELNAAKRLLSNVVTKHKKLFEIIVYDALACNSKWINHCIDLGIDTVVRVKNNNNKNLRRVKKKINKSEPTTVWESVRGLREVKVYESTFTMENVNKPLRFIKFAMKRPDGKRSQIMITTTCIDIDLYTLFKIIRARWDIENSVFNNLKKECGLEHCYVHGGNAVEAVLCLIFIASNLLQLFYHRRIRKHVATQRELIRLLFKGLYLLKRRAELILDSG